LRLLLIFTEHLALLALRKIEHLPELSMASSLMRGGS
jgi:hypothetical protein